MYKKIVRKVEEWRNNFNLITDGTGMIDDYYLANKLIDEEEKEYDDAIKERDIIEQVDALADRIFVYVQFINVMWGKTPKYTFNTRKRNIVNKIKQCIKELKSMGLNPYDIIEEVYNSNMSKSCHDIVKAKESVESYKISGVDTAYYKQHGDLFLIYRISDNKLLKGIHFYKPNLNKFLHV